MGEINRNYWYNKVKVFVMWKLNIVSGNIFDYLEGKDLIVNSAN